MPQLSHVRRKPRKMTMSNPNPRHFAGADTVVSPVVEAGGFVVGVSGHALRYVELAAVYEVIGDAGGTEGVAADCRFEVGVSRAAADYLPDISAGEWPSGELAGAPDGAARNSGPLRSPAI